MAPSPPDKPLLVQWLLDTRNLYPSAAQTSDLTTHASRALALLTPTERAAVLRYVRPADAKMSLASHLLKRYLITRFVPSTRWWAATTTRDARTKPVFLSPPGSPRVDFNVSHQAGLVALAAVVSPPAQDGDSGPVDIGTDVVSPTERRQRDRDMIAADGWAAFVDMHADVFAPSEAAYLKWSVLARAAQGQLEGGPDAVLDYKLRAFYTLWCLREAYVKMTGEALLAEWLGVLEFRGFRPPPVPPPEGVEMRQGEGVTDHDVWFRGEKVADANVCIRTLGGEYMLCTAVRTPGRTEVGLGMELGPFEFLSLDDVLDFAESRI